MHRMRIYVVLLQFIYLMWSLSGASVSFHTASFTLFLAVGFKSTSVTLHSGTLSKCKVLPRKSYSIMTDTAVGFFSTWSGSSSFSVRCKLKPATWRVEPLWEALKYLSDRRWWHLPRCADVPSRDNNQGQLISMQRSLVQVKTDAAFVICLICLRGMHQLAYGHSVPIFLWKWNLFWVIWPLSPYELQKN